MTATFASLPCPAANGAGAATDLSLMGLTKTITVTGAGVYTVNIEVNNAEDETTGSWSPVCRFVNGGAPQVIKLAGRWFRARMSSYRSGTPLVGVGASDAGTTFADLDVPVNAGKGTPVDISALPAWKTVQVGGEFAGQLIVELSNDGSTDFSQIVAFSKPGQYTFLATADFARIGRVAPATGSPIVTMGGADDASSSSGFFAMAHIANQEAAVLLAGTNIASVNYASPFLFVNLVTPVPDDVKAILSVTPNSASNPPNGWEARMVTASQIRIAFYDVAAAPVLLGCYVLVALVP